MTEAFLWRLLNARTGLAQLSVFPVRHVFTVNGPEMFRVAVRFVAGGMGWHGVDRSAGQDGFDGYNSLQVTALVGRLPSTILARTAAVR